MNEIEANERRAEWKRKSELTRFLIDTLSIDETTANFAVDRFAHEWILQAVIQAKLGDRPKGLFCFYMNNPKKVTTAKPLTPARQQGRPGNEPPHEHQPPLGEAYATPAEISDICDAWIAKHPKQPKKGQ